MAKKPYDSEWKPKKIAAKLARMAGVKGHRLKMAAPPKRVKIKGSKGRVDAFVMVCVNCEKTVTVEIHHNEEKIKFRDFDPLNDPCKDSEVVIGGDFNTSNKPSITIGGEHQDLADNMLEDALAEASKEALSHLSEEEMQQLRNTIKNIDPSELEDQ